MTDKISPQDMVVAMIEAVENAESASALPVPGTYAGKFGESMKDSLNAENVEAFIDGTAVINLLIQEAILRITAVAAEVRGSLGPSDPQGAIYAEGVSDGVMMLAQIMGATADNLVRSLIEGPVIERAFNGIVSGI